MFHCPVGVWVIEQHAIILSATVRSPTVVLATKSSNASQQSSHLYQVPIETEITPSDSLNPCVVSNVPRNT